jgi:diacylglycerol kinase (ATP)
MAKHVQIATNPDAGSYSARKIKLLRAAFERCGATTSLSYVGPGRQLMIEDDADLLCVAGGDGTIRHAAATMLERSDAGKQPVRIAPFPMGTVNLFQRDTASPRQAEPFAERALSGSGIENHFPVAVNDTLFLSCASVGPDALAVSGLSSRLKSVIGRAAYGAAMAKLIAKWPRPKLTLIADGKRHSVEAVYVAKGAHFAGPWSFAPNADRKAAKLHVVALKRAGRRDFWRFMRNIMRGRPLDDRDNIVTFTCTALLIESDESWPIQIDGDDGGVLPARMSTRADTLRMG